MTRFRDTSGGESRHRVLCPISYRLGDELRNRKGNQMLFDRDQFSMIQEVNTLQEAAARTGFTVSEIQALVECELETSQVLDYISAVLSNRMN